MRGLTQCDLPCGKYESKPCSLLSTSAGHSRRANLIEFISAVVARTKLLDFWRLWEIMATKEELLKKILEGPGLKPPPNVIPNLINPPTKQHINLLCQVTCLTLSSLFVLIRMYTKIYVMGTHGWEDGMHYRITVLQHRKINA